MLVSYRILIIQAIFFTWTLLANVLCGSTEWCSPCVPVLIYSKMFWIRFERSPCIQSWHDPILNCLSDCDEFGWNRFKFWMKYMKLRCHIVKFFLLMVYLTDNTKTRDRLILLMSLSERANIRLYHVIVHIKQSPMKKNNSITETYNGIAVNIFK